MGGDDKYIAILSLASGTRHILMKDGTNARYTSAGYLLYVRAGLLMAVPFDIDNLEITGSAVKVIEGIKFSHAGSGQYCFSGSSILAWVPAIDQMPVNLENSSPGFRKVVESSLQWIDRQGSTQRISQSAAGYWAPNISPNGQQLALTTELDIFILDLVRGAFTRLTFEGRNHIPVWTPDGRYLVFSSARNGQSNLFWKMADGSGTAERLLTSKQHQDPGSWSPDGKTLTYAELHPETKWDIWLLHPEEKRNTVPLIQTRFNEYHPMISPDGQWLAYTSDESGQLEVYVRPFPAGRGKWLISTEGGWEPRWGRDGRELFFRNGRKVMRAALKYGSSFIATRPEVLFERENAGQEMDPRGSPNYDVSPDGRFLMIRPKPSPLSRQINFRLNWFEDLKHRIPEDG